MRFWLLLAGHSLADSSSFFPAPFLLQYWSDHTPIDSLQHVYIDIHLVEFKERMKVDMTEE